MSLSRWFALCESIGIDARNYEPIEIFFLGGKIIKDPYVRSCQGIGENPKAKYNGKTAAQVIEAFTKEEKLVLRDRILGVREIGK